MRKGIFSFVIYIIYALLGGGMMVYNYIAIQKHNAEGGGWEGLGLAILFIIGLILGAAGLLGVILKGIQLGTGWGFFGFLCVILDLVCVAVLVSQVFMNESVEILEAWPVIAITVLPVISCITNAISIRK